MYASALMHFVVGIYSWIGEGLSGYQLLTSSSPTGRIILATLTINSIFSDAVALWRACVVWMNRPIIVIVSAVLLATGIVSGIANLVLVATSSPEVLIFGPYYDWPGIVFLSSSLLSNAFSTAVIGFKAWSHRRRLRGHLFSSRRTMAEKILILFVESGAVFICIWAAYIALVVRFNTLGGVIIGNQLVPLYAFHSALIQIITIYPTSIILLVVLEKRQIMRGGSTTSKTSSPQLDYKLPPIVTINTMVHTEPEGVIVIGHDALTAGSSRDDFSGGHKPSQEESNVEKRSEGDGTPRYVYFDYVVLQAENALFNLPRQLLAGGSGVFVDMFALPPGENGQEGWDNGHPIKLPGVTAKDLRGFLRTYIPYFHSKAIACLAVIEQTRNLTVEEVMRLEPLFGMKTMGLLLAVKERMLVSNIGRGTSMEPVENGTTAFNEENMVVAHILFGCIGPGEDTYTLRTHDPKFQPSPRAATISYHPPISFTPSPTTSRMFSAAPGSFSVGPFTSLPTAQETEGDPKERSGTAGSQGETSTIVRDETFYFDCVAFRVENVLFKLPRQELAKSGVLEDMFNLPQLDPNHAEGREDEHPIHLPGVTAAEFRGFLKAVHLFHTSISVACDGNERSHLPLLPATTRTCDDPNVVDRGHWTSCLKVTTLWQLNDIRKRAIAELDKLEWNPIDKIVLAKNNRVSRWLIEEYERVIREDLLDVEAVNGRLGREIGITTTCLLFAVQKRGWQQAMQGAYYTEEAIVQQKQLDFLKCIREVFEDELSLDEFYVPLERPVDYDV
ncbi:uncharacterized protein STEHIDRAFT_107771 [Stereum hirsutum FP-91666 SS1]|uniref:uncharacterized protein n=1 Tax=Stereum hirsutum (strain FP-91666) TaxID=721885 RepID=UPI000440CF0D|nr:uncharacterized protein STEHIDRAFT_107771 [Stereum hirsutum FP-91666 SS1]EIM91158.1 hypothetical protein STEHIDRAFT_107771 [Stereum hirsutum FP-91666 SS1]